MRVEGGLCFLFQRGALRMSKFLSYKAFLSTHVYKDVMVVMDSVKQCQNSISPAAYNYLFYNRGKYLYGFHHYIHLIQIFTLNICQMSMRVNTVILQNYCSQLYLLQMKCLFQIMYYYIGSIELYCLHCVNGSQSKIILIIKRKNGVKLSAVQLS